MCEDAEQFCEHCGTAHAPSQLCTSADGMVLDQRYRVGGMDSIHRQPLAEDIGWLSPAPQGA